MSAPQKVLELVDVFERNVDDYRSSQFNEAMLRQQFINPLFKQLGWDMENERGDAEAYKDVIHEASLKIGDETKAPDYCFRIGGTPKFYLEAKKPAVNVKNDPSPAFQLRRYGWSKKLPLCILTNFEEFAVYDCRVKPAQTDKASTARILYLHYTDFDKEWDAIAGVFSLDAVRKGSFDKYADSNKAKKGTATVDTAFLQEIESWRMELAKNLALRNPKLSTRDLNYAVQITIDRVIFLRICEDRGIEPYGQLRNLQNEPDIYEQLRSLYRKADDRYNSGLFHFRKEPGRTEAHDELTLRLKIDDKILKTILNGMYYPDSPYEFSVLPAEILGQVYEQFLGKVIRLTASHQAKVEEKPEVKKAGGVYYTPAYIVEYIVKQTVGRLLDDKGPKQAAKLKFLDPACGSGSFLLGAYQYLLDWHLEKYLDDGPAKHKKELFQTASGDWRLITSERKRILLNNIFGVDIDPQAVEVTKLSLLLKVLEGESQQTIDNQLKMFHERALPDLARNIKCGNSLIGPDFYDGQKVMRFDEEEQYRINVFDWKVGFSEIMKAGGFDAVIGNPPWLMAGYYVPETIDYIRHHFQSAEGKFDLYYVFIEQSCRLLSTLGLFGMIVPNKFFHTKAASTLRNLLRKDRWIRSIVDFGDEKVFSGATNYSCVVILQKQPGPNPKYSEAKVGLSIVREFTVPWSMFDSQTWHFEEDDARRLFEKMEKIGTPLECLTSRFGTGVQSGADSILMVDRVVASQRGLEPELLRPAYKGRDVRRYNLCSVPKLLMFPYEIVADEFRILPELRLQNCGKVYRLLASQKSKLAERIWFGKSAQEVSGKWYGMMYLDSYGAFAAPHILTPSLSNRSNFTLGTGNLFVTGTAGVTSIIPKEDLDEGIYYLLGILNSVVPNTPVELQ